MLTVGVAMAWLDSAVKNHWLVNTIFGISLSFFFSSLFLFYQIYKLWGRKTELNLALILIKTIFVLKYTSCSKSLVLTGSYSLILLFDIDWTELWRIKSNSPRKIIKVQCPQLRMSNIDVTCHIAAHAIKSIKHIDLTAKNETVSV